jgi:hypothetical protein
MKRILAAFALLMAGVLAGGWAAAQVNGQGGVYINGVLQGVGGGTGTVTSVGLTLPSFMNVSGTNPITTSGTFTLGLANVSSTLAFLGPATGSPAAPTFRAIATTDLASPDASGVLTSNGSGALSWSAAPATGANRALSNLTGVAINDHLTPGTPLAISIGGGNLPFIAVHTGTNGLSTWNGSTDAYPLWQYTGTGIIAGAGSATAPDVGMIRSSAGLFKFTNASTGSGSIAATSLTRVAASSDVAPSSTLVKSGDAFPGAATNTAGANTVLAGGIGRRIFTVVAYDNATVPLSTVTITVNDAATVKTEGTDWFDTTGNNEMATSLASAIDGIAGVSATASSAVVRIVPDIGTYSLTIAKTAADAGMTATSGIDGVVNICGPTYYAVSGTVQLGTDTGNGRDGLYLKHINSDSGNAPYQYAFLVPDYTSADTGGYPYASLAGRALLATEQFVLGPDVHIKWFGTIANNLNYINPRTGISESAGVLTITDGSTGFGAESLDTNSKILADTVTLSDNVKTAVLDIAIADGEFIGGTLSYTITATDATDHQALTGIVGFSGVRKNGTPDTYHLTIAESASPVLAESSGVSTLTDTWAIDAGTNVATISVTADSSLTTPTMTVRYQLSLNSANAVTKK